MDVGDRLELAVEMVGDLGVIRVDGEVDHATAAQLQTCAETVLEDGARNLVLDLAQVSFMDSSGLKVIIRVRNRANERGGTMAVRHASDIVGRVMDVTGLGPLLVPGPEHEPGGA